MSIRVALVEDDLNLARSLYENLSAFKEVDMLFVAGNGQEALQQLPAHLPDVLLMDIHMPVMDGIETTRRVSHLFPSVKVIMLTVFDETEKIFQCILAGAVGYLLKDEKPEKILEAAEEAMEGGAPMSPPIAAKALRLIRENTNLMPENAFNLSAREIQVLECIARGETYQQIAERLFISPRTVRKHIENIYRKLQVHNKVEAMHVALKHKLV